ncbi:thiol:disulfide interchange protein DsbA/DsbL [Candidatus Kinetoplastidibacterium galati]|uniref:Thiol:disulfide interchange protein n=1 Tax=Candidatus Kinetoplastidibacterium galati TCC219 TaxID=1208921 RepID=M1L846_9PROT|nr:thiol:disulfide interchange protein DsbA/DsbL [Candidatus Kinetoplastibacterium galatii]AGF48733.1 thiol:disulfide interchange protein DsbA [Candidatus Kinetoplastibacterium galatii TCC219]
MMKLYKKYQSLIKISFFIIIFLISNNCNSQNKYEILKSKIENISQNSTDNSKSSIEIIEFLSYMCHHCTAIENILNQWQSSIPADVILIKIPICSNKKSEVLQKLYLTINEINKPYLHCELFHMFAKEKKSITHIKDLNDWLISKNINVKEFLELYNSFYIQSKSNRANQLAKLCRIKGIPTFVVGGKYTTSPAIAGDEYECTINTINYLIEKIRKE